MTPSVGGISYIVHESPVWRPENSYMAVVDLAPFGFDNEQEQIWLRPLSEDQFEVCCIPFRVYGMALGDVVRLKRGRFIESVIAPSGRLVFRVKECSRPQTDLLKAVAAK